MAESLLEAGALVRRLQEITSVSREMRLVHIFLSVEGTCPAGGFSVRLASLGLERQGYLFIHFFINMSAMFFALRY